MLQARNFILGSTPIRNTSATIAARRQLFHTPSATGNPNVPFTPTTSTANNAASSTADMNTPRATLVQHVQDSSDRSGLTGVILRPSTGPTPTTLDVLWTFDAQTTRVLPSNLQILPQAQTPATTATTAAPPVTPTTQTAIAANVPTALPNIQVGQPPARTSSSGRGYKPLLSAKIPKELRESCPLDSTSLPEIELSR